MQFEGVVSVLKPPGMTSSDVVVDIRRIFGERRVGHTGTLDPAAAGVLPICIGRATRLFDYLVDKEKEYIANKFDMDSINRTVIAHYDQPEEVKKEIAQWYEELIEMMRSEGVMEKGHIQLNKNVIITLTDLHLRLLKSPKEMVYSAAYYKTLPYIVQLRAKSGGEDLPELETCFAAVYGYLLLRMQGKEVSAETLEGIKQISSFLALLAEKYREDMKGELKLED